MRNLSKQSAICIAAAAFFIFNSCKNDDPDPRASDEILFNPNLTYGTVSDIEGNTYKTIEVGDQVWMAENLRVTQYNDGTTIPNVENELSWKNTTSPAYSWYENKEGTYAIPYGALYNWYTVNSGELCPVGWHIPSVEEWETLIWVNLDGQGLAGGKMKEKGFTHWESAYIYAATNSSGFSALPGGFRNSGDGHFYQLGEFGYWWSSSEKFDSPYALRLNFNDNYTYFFSSITSSGNSIRCVKD